MLYLTVHLYGRSGTPGEFKAYEQKALGIFKKHGGEVVVAYAPDRPTGSQEVPDEIQVLRIESREALEKFKNDPERASLASERGAVIRRTDVFLAAEQIDYQDP